MDVRAWLQNTADREPPDEEDSAGFPDYLRPERYPAEEHTQRHKGKRKRVSSEPYSAQRRPSRGRFGGHGRAASDESSSGLVRGVRTDTASSRSSPSAERRESSPDRRFNRTFERRARHKTKEDRYEPKAKKPRKEHESRRESTSKSRSKRRKSHRRGDGARTAGLVTSFQLKDRPNNNRLTLRPANVSAGIFKHGRAGAPLTGKGSGLPDLVFNEMKFLRRPREHQDDIVRNYPEKERRERADKQQEGNNISTYFAKPHTEAPQPREQQEPVAALDQHPGIRSQETQQAARTNHHHDDGDGRAAGDSRANSFLGFGSRGPDRDIHDANRRSNSCYTWSESMPAPRSSIQEPVVRKNTPMANSTTYPLEKATADRPLSVRHLDGSQGGIVKRTRAMDSTGRWRSKRPQDSASIEIYRPAVPAQTSYREDALPTRHRSSLSLPRSGLIVPRPHFRAINSQRIPGSCSTSDILRIRDHSHDDGDQSVLHPRNILCERSSEKENQDPSRSTPTSKLLRRAFDTITGTRAGNKVRREHDEFEDLERHVSSAQPSDDTVQYHSRMIAEHPQRLDRLFEQHGFKMPQRGFSRSTDASHAKQQQPTARPPTRAGSFANMPPVLPRPTFARLRKQAVNFDEEMLDTAPNYTPFVRAQQYTFTNSRQADDLVRRLTSNQQQELSAPQRAEQAYLPTPSVGLGEFRGRFTEVEEAGFLRTDSEATGLSTGHPYSHLRSHNDIPHMAPDPGGGEVQHERMPAFWKPNKLY